MSHSLARAATRETQSAPRHQGWLKLRRRSGAARSRGSGDRGMRRDGSERDPSCSVLGNILNHSLCISSGVPESVRQSTPCSRMCFWCSFGCATVGASC
eukprot:1043446-Pyramimonas_sp.AAC.1